MELEIEVEDKRVTSHQPTSNRSKTTGTSVGSTSNGDAMHDGFNFVQLAHVDIRKIEFYSI